MKKMSLLTMLAMIVVTALVLLNGCSPGSKLSVDEQKQVAADMEAETLARLYKEEPATKGKIRRAAGYGVFSNANVNLIFVSAGGGYGIVTDNSTGKKPI